MTKTRATLVLALVFAATVLFRLSPQFAQPVAPPEAALWVATNAQLLKLDPTDGDVLEEPPDTRKILRVTADESREKLWTYSQGKLSAFDDSGILLVSAKVPVPASSTANLALTVNSDSGVVWLGIQKKLLKYSSEGQLLASSNLAAQVQDLSFDPISGRLWVATQTSVTAVNAAGAVVKNLQLPRNSKAAALAVDRLTGSIWVALSTTTGPRGQGSNLDF